MFIFIVVIWGLVILFRLETKMKQVQDSLNRIEKSLEKTTAKPIEPLTAEQKKAAAEALAAQPHTITKKQGTKE